MVPPLPDTTGTTSATETGDSSASGSGSSGTVGHTGSSGGSTTSDESGGGDTATGGEICTSEYQPVCGKDGETYDHPCNVPEGVGIRREGPCFGDCEGSCSTGPAHTSIALALALLLAVRRRGGRR